jgi:hypothetical protein
MEGFIVCLKNIGKINFFDTRLFLACKNKKNMAHKTIAAAKKKRRHKNFLSSLKKEKERQKHNIDDDRE